MKKETVIAIVLGIAFGAAVAFFLIVQTKGQNQAKVIPVTTSNITPVMSNKTNAVTQTLNITAPENNSVTDKDSVTIKGKASKGSLLVIQSPLKYVIKTLNADDFSESFPLAFGENIIEISVYPKDTKLGVQQRSLAVYQLDEK